MSSVQTVKHVVGSYSDPFSPTRGDEDKSAAPWATSLVSPYRRERDPSLDGIERFLGDERKSFKSNKAPMALVRKKKPRLAVCAKKEPDA